MRICLLTAALVLSLPARAQTITFADAGAGLPGTNFGALAWGDVDGDGDLDLAINGDTDAGTITRVYRNTGGAFISAGAGLPGTQYGALAWADYDRDGDLDLALSGDTGAGSVTRIYRNTDGAFADAGAGLPGTRYSALAWADYDRDGDLDLALSGDTGAGFVTRIYRNTDGAFADAGAGLPGTRYSALAWADYDRDGDLDLALSGDTGAGFVTRIYRNTDGAFADAGAGLPGTRYGALAWGDYNLDGNLDLALSGDTGSGTITRIYRNTGGTFADAGAGFPGTNVGGLVWGDYDRDGDLDLALAGDTRLGYFVTRIYRNTGGTFADAGAGLPPTSGPLTWSDYDGDGDLDLALSGFTSSSTDLLARVYRSSGAAPNARPTTPTGLTAAVADDAVTLSWLTASDDATPNGALSYNVRVETADGARLLVSPLSLSGGTADGRRLVPAPGNAGQRRVYILRGLPRGVAFRWSVQSVDDGFAASPFAADRAVATGTPAAALTLAGDPGWRMLAAPRDGLSYGSVLGRLWTQGFPGSDAPSAPAATCNAFTFDETVRADRDGDGRVTLHDGWRCLASQAASWPVGTGLMVYVYADDNGDGQVTAAEAFPKTIALAGAVVRAPLAGVPLAGAALSFTDDPAVLHSQEGWNLVGNPLSFGLAWDAVRRTRVGGTLTFYDPAALGRAEGDYRAYTAGGVGDVPGGVVPPGQGFFVKAEGPGPALSVPYTASAASDPPLYGRPGEVGDGEAGDVEAGGADAGEADAGDVGETPGTPGAPGGPAQVAGGATAAGDTPAALTASLDAVRPNPVVGTATIAYAVASSGPVRLSVVDVLGRAVAVLAEGERVVGRYTAVLAAGSLPAGVYVVRLEAGGASLSRRITVAR